MSREFNRHIERQFARLMQKFDLEPAKAVGPIAWPGERCFGTRGGESRCWICIFPNSKGLNEFNVELAWSHRGAYPVNCTMRPTVCASPPECFHRLAEGFIRLGELAQPVRARWGAFTLQERLAILSPEAAVMVATPLIDDAIHVIEMVGLPLAAQAVAARATFLANASVVPPNLTDL